MDEASAAKLEELCLGAVSEGKEWLSRSLSEIARDELRVLAAACGVKTRSDKAWLPVAELRSSLMKVLEPSTEVGFNQKMCFDMSCSRERLQRVLRKKAAVILHLHTFTSADLHLHTLNHPNIC